jgi:riboflavin kinase/FMN adenylyltransferase
LAIKGQRLGRELGFATANLERGEKQYPPDGVWAVAVKIGDDWNPGVANLGVRPTVASGGRSLEVHLFEWEKDLYG